ncbi:MAG: hypothetical protein WA996_12465, partial [Candidatus Promineifilaceae bacterium]
DSLFAAFLRKARFSFGKRVVVRALLGQVQLNYQNRLGGSWLSIWSRCGVINLVTSNSRRRLHLAIVNAK